MGFEEFGKGFEAERPALSYIYCYPTEPRRSLAHSERNAVLASYVSLRYLYTGSVWLAVRDVWGYPYPRLVYYTLETHLVEGGKAWGKLMEYQVTGECESPEDKPKLWRTNSFRILLSAPIAISCSDLNYCITEEVERIYEYAVLLYEQIIHRAFEADPRYHHLTYLLDAMEYYAVGCRDFVGTRGLLWCNGVVRLPLGGPIVVDVEVRSKQTAYKKRYQTTTPFPDRLLKCFEEILREKAMPI